MTSVRFLQFSDLHAGRSVEGSRLLLDAGQRDRLRSERLDCLETIVDVAIEEGVEVVLVPGDLFEEDRVRKEEVERIRRAFEALQDVPVVITPGNHDYYSPLSWYRQDVMRKHNLEAWPGNVHVFTGHSFRSRRIPELESLRVTGFAYRKNRSVTEWPAGDDVTPDSDTLDVLLVHGSLSSARPSGKMNTLPFDEERIHEHPVDYVAMGHYHTVHPIELNGTLRGAYAGTPMGVTLSDTGDRHVLLGELTPEGVPLSSLEKRRVCPRRIFDLSIEGRAGASPSRFRRRVQERFQEEGVCAPDLVRLNVTGEHPGEEVLDSNSLQSFMDEYFYVELDVSRTAPPLDAELYREGTERAGTTEGQFVREMLERIDGATSEEQAEIARKALRIGLSAFRREDVDLNHVL